MLVKNINVEFKDSISVQENIIGLNNELFKVFEKNKVFVDIDNEKVDKKLVKLIFKNKKVAIGNLPISEFNNIKEIIRNYIKLKKSNIKFV